MANDADIVVRVRSDGVEVTDANLRRLMVTGNQTVTVTGRVGSGFDKMSAKLDAFNAVSRVAAAGALLATLGGYVTLLAKTSDAWTNLTNKLVNANTAHEQMATIQERVFDIAQRTRSDLDATSTLYSRLARSLQQYGITATEVGKITETVSKSMIVSGASTAEANAAIVQFSQGLQSGVLRGDEFNSVMEQAPRLGKMIADGLGVGTGELRKMAGQGKLTADVVIAAVQKASSTIDEEFGRTLPTFAQNWNVASNNLTKFIGTSQTANSIISTLGSGVVALSNNMDTLVTVAGGLATVVGGRVVAALVAKAAAAISAGNADVIASANAQALNGVLTSSVGVTANKASADLKAAQTALTLARAEYTVAKASGDSSAAKAALTAATVTHRNAVIQEIAAKEALAVAMRNATVTTTAFTTATTLAKGALALVGGPVGAAILAATAIYQFATYSKQATEDAKTFADSTDQLTASLRSMTDAQRAALAVKAQSSIRELTELQAKQNAELQEGLKVQQFYTEQLKRRQASGRDTSDTEQNLTIITERNTLRTAELETTNKRLAQSQELVNQATNSALPIMDEIISKYEALHQKGGVINLGGPLDDLKKKLSGVNDDIEVTTMKADGNARSAAVLGAVYSALGKDVDKYRAIAQGVVAGSINAQNANTDEEKTILALANAQGKLYDEQQRVAAAKKAPAAAKAQDRAEDSWNKRYERIEARSATFLDKIKAQEDSEIRMMNESADKAKASTEERESALAAIREKYNRQREEGAAKYSPLQNATKQYQDVEKEIAQLAKTPLVTDKEVADARLKNQADFIKQKIAIAKEGAVSEVDQLKAQYDPVQEAKNSYAEQLAVLEEAHNNQLMSDSKFYDLRSQAYGQFLQKQAVAQNQETLSFIQSTSTMAQSFATVLATMGDNSSAAYKTAFALSKAFSIANATLNLSSAISQALADPSALTPAQKFANMAAVAAAGGQLITSIASASLTGMAHDGITDVPEEGTWLLQKGERVLSAQQNADFKNYMTGSGGSINNAGHTINQYITVSGNGDAALNQAMQTAAKQGAEQGYSKVLQDTTSRGNISRSIGR